MISERRTALLEAVNWEKKSSPCLPSTPGSSLKDRLTALTKSSETWHNRVKKDDELTKLGNPRRSSVGKENGFIKEPPTSKIGLLLSLDKGLDSFFPSNSSPVISSIEMDLDSIEKTEILVTPRRPQPQKMSRGRPKDSRLATIDIASVRIEEDPRDCIDPIILDSDDDDSPVAKSAKAGLEAVEDYSSTKDALREVDTTSPYPPLMLIRVKGEKKVDVRLVAPKVSSVDQAAVFVLVTPNKLLKYEGDQANIMEKTKANQICINITTKADLHCSAKSVETHSGDSYSFCRLLEEEKFAKKTALPLEPFENIAARLNLVIRVTDNYSIQSVSKGERVRFSMLQPRDTLIFDFGSEIYVWSGRMARKTTGRYAVEYAKKLKTKPVPLTDGILGDDFSSSRPNWILYRRIMQGVQDILFSSKFADWKTNETKGVCSSMTPRSCCVGSLLTPRNNTYEARQLAETLKALVHPEPMTILEEQELTRRMKDVVTESTKFWQLKNEELKEIDDMNIFLNDQCYVIRWQYRIQLSGVRKLKTGEEHEKETGRERIAFFYWLGARTTPKQQGLCALKLSHMDKEKRPHLRIAQGLETPLFLQLFSGSLIIRSSSPDVVPFFLVRGITTVEGHAAQFDEKQPLRAHGVYIDIREGKAKLIAGSDCEEIAVKNGLILAKEIVTNYRKIGIKIDSEVTTSVQEDDPTLSWITAKGRTQCPRFYRIYETEGSELFSPQYHKQLGFPFLQAVLSDTMLIDVGMKLWIWSEKAPSTFALRVAEKFWEGRIGDATVILKYHEPETFIALFDSWKEWEKLEEENTPPSPPKKLEDVMVERSKIFSLFDLKTRTNLPDGIDLKNLEQYLNDEEFQTAFKMDRSTFDSLPAWKQIRLRKEVGLF